MPNYFSLKSTAAEHKLADTVVSAAARQLRIKAPKIYFFDHKLSHDGRTQLAGWTEGDGRTIHLKAGRRPIDLAKTCAHEVRHCFQKSDRRFNLMSDDFFERDAHTFAESFALRFSSNAGSCEELIAKLEELEIRVIRAAYRATVQKFPGWDIAINHVDATLGPIVERTATHVTRYWSNGLRLTVPSDEWMAAELGRQILYGN
jgi:hypothetical protein